MLIPLNRMDKAVRERKKAGHRHLFLALGVGSDFRRESLIRRSHQRGPYALGSQPHQRGTHGVLSRAYLYKGMEKEAAEELQKSLTLDDEKAEAKAVHEAFGQGGYLAVRSMQLDELKKQAKEKNVSPRHLLLTSASCTARRTHFVTWKKLIENALQVSPSCSTPRNSISFTAISGIKQS
jgi:hypothetical protein